MKTIFKRIAEIKKLPLPVGVEEKYVVLYARIEQKFFRRKKWLKKIEQRRKNVKR
jgi:hypothetical protein